MLSNENNMINLGNYEEYFILYMDNELSADEKSMVENFITQHPHLAEELDILMSTKLTLDEVSFTNKEELLSSSMKVNTVDEALLLYVDNELPAADKKQVEARIASNKDYALQHSVLMQTKLDASEQIPYPNKKELHKHTEKIIAFKGWMRIAAAVVILLFGSLFFLVNNQKSQGTTPGAITSTVTTAPGQQIKRAIEDNQPGVVGKIQQPTVTKQEQNLVQLPANKTQKTLIVQQNLPAKKEGKANLISTPDNDPSLAQQIEKQREVIRFDASRFTQVNEITADAVVVNNNITHKPVTFDLPVRKPNEDTPEETAGSDGDFKNTKKTSAKGFFRKVSRFIERNTGIGTANSDEQTLIGAVALKLK